MASLLINVSKIVSRNASAATVTSVTRAAPRVSGQSCGHSPTGVTKYCPKQIAARADPAAVTTRHLSRFDRRNVSKLLGRPETIRDRKAASSTNQITSEKNSAVATARNI